MRPAVRCLTVVAGVVLLLAEAVAIADARPPAGSTMTDLRARTGRPNAIRFDDAGDQVWEYNDRRTGWGGYVITFNGDGTVREVRQVRTPEQIAAVQPGATGPRELLELLGEPHKMRFLGDDRAWEYCQPGGGSLRVRIGPDGKVTEVTAKP